MKAVIISAQRCGGLFLAGCLSNHPDIHCPREEPFRRESIWQEKLGLGHAALLDFVLSEPYYQVSMCRLTYDQAFDAEVRGYVLENQVRIVHLVREALATVTSTLLAKQEMARGVPRHDFDGSFVDDEVLDVGPEEVLKRMGHLKKQRARFEELYFYGEAKQLLVWYEDITRGGEVLFLDAKEMKRICEFLGVEYATLCARNRKMHRRPLATYYARWDEIEPVLRAGKGD